MCARSRTRTSPASTRNSRGSRCRGSSPRGIPGGESMMRRARSVLLLVLLFAAAALPARSATVQDFDTSIRAAGMGGATTGVGWGEPGVWGNPASLATFRGIAWLEGTTRLIPEIDPPVRLKSRRFVLGAPGIGLSLMGEPIDALGHTRLEYRQTGTDPFGNIVAGPELADEMDAWG